MEFNHGEIEARWKSFWKENNTYEIEEQYDKPKFYVLDMFPYPSGAGLHVGHPLGYIATDIYARYKKMKGFNVLHPMGYDAFGLPAEQYAIQTGIHPSVSTDENIKRYRSQLDNIGFNYDWSRSLKTNEPSFYKWTQWIFIQLYESYYDIQLDKAQPIQKLIDLFTESGSQNTKAFTNNKLEFSADEWRAFTAKERDDILMDYRLAYRKVGYVNWCEALGTVLANDEIKDGVSERGGHPVEKKAMMQWSLRITAYAQRLLDGLDTIDWSDALKAMQRNWIGRSEGAQVFFDIDGHEGQIEIYTTRPDTIFGATYMVLAPEHDLVESLTTDAERQKVQDYLDYVASRSDVDRMADSKEVTGVFTGAYAIHPFSGKKLPIWLGEYVLKDYGTGAIMAVPSDDERDHKFATKFNLEIIQVVDQSEFADAKIGEKVGKMINSDFLDGMEVKDAIKATIAKIEEQNLGSGKVNFKLRDANFSRQRYWGEPFPISYDADDIGHTDTLDQLPIELPPLENFKPAEGGKSPLARATDWVSHEGRIRETDTMPGYAGSSWYFLRYMDANNDEEFASQEAINYWQSVDLYIGGTEHAVGHLMYSRFWHKFLYDLGKVPTQEPFKKLINQGMIQGVIEFIYLQKEKENGFNKFVCAGLAEKRPELEYAKIPVHIDFVNEYGNKESFLDLDSIKKFIDWRPEYQDAIFECSKGTYHKGLFNSKGADLDSHLVTHSEVGKMSKRYFNVVNPDVVVEKYGADTFRMYEMFLGPIEQSKPWDTQGIEGVSKFIRRFWGLFHNGDQFIKCSHDDPSKEALKILHKTIKKVSEDIENFSFNTSVSAFMVAVNELKKINCTNATILSSLTKLLAPFAPFITEEIWKKLGNESSIHHSEYPQFDESHLIEDEVQYPLCVNGKKRALASFPNGAAKDEIEKAALSNVEIQKWIEGKEIVKVIVVPGRMVNIVVKG